MATLLLFQKWFYDLLEIVIIFCRDILREPVYISII